MMRMFFVYIGLLLFSLTSQAQNAGNGTTYLENDRVRLKLEKTGNVVQQQFFAKKDGSWKLVAESFVPPVNFPDSANQLLNTSVDEYRYLTTSSGQSVTKSGSQVTIAGELNGIAIRQEISLNGSDENFHIVVKAVFPEQQNKLEYLLSAYRFVNKGAPEFIHTPTLKYNEERWETPERQQVLGDRSFHSPAVVLQQQQLFFALVPDLDAINDHRVLSPDARRTIKIPRNKFSVPLIESKYTMPTGLDLNVRSGLTEDPIVVFGFMDNIIQHHIRYLHPNNGEMVRTVLSKELEYAFDLFISAGKKEYDGYQDITKFIWEKYGHHVFTGHRHLAMPFTQYVNTICSVTFSPMEVQPPVEGYANTGSFLEFEMNGLPVGGFRSAVPGWTDALWNSVFWNNARDAVGIYLWGKRLKDSLLIDRSRRTVNLLLLAPQNKQGLFPLIYRAAQKKWQLSSYDIVNGKYGLFSAGPESETYDVVAMSKTCAHLLDYFKRCENDKRIIKFTTKYADWLAKTVDAQGMLPSYVSVNMEPSPVLRKSAQSATTMWFLAEMYSITKKKAYLDAAKRIAAFLAKEVVPLQLWTDLEQYFSCGIKSLSFKGDSEQGEPARGNLSVGWASYGFASLFAATGDTTFLRLGEQCIDYLTFTQCSWNPHYIYTAYPFGGFSVDNSDHATYLDARQAEYVKPLIWYGKKLGRSDLIERGVAAARASVVLINHPLHKMNGIYEYTNIYTFGLGPENIDHEGHPQSAMRTHAGWGEGSGIFAGLSDAVDALEGGYIDVKKNIAVGVDGINISSFKFDGNNRLNITITSRLAKLDVPYDDKYLFNVLITGLPPGKEINIAVNGEVKHFSVPQSGNITVPLIADENTFLFKK